MNLVVRVTSSVLFLWNTAALAMAFDLGEIDIYTYNALHSINERLLKCN